MFFEFLCQQMYPLRSVDHLKMQGTLLLSLAVTNSITSNCPLSWTQPIFPRICFFSQSLLALLIFHHLSLLVLQLNTWLSQSPRYLILNSNYSPMDIVIFLLSAILKLHSSWTLFPLRVWDGRGSTGHPVLAICYKLSLFIMHHRFCSMTWL